MDTSQIISVAIFVVAMIAIMTEKVHRALVAITGAMLLLILHIMPFETAIGHIDFNTLGVLFGMMLFVAVVKQSGVFEFLAIKCARVAKGNPWTIMVLFVLLTAVLSAFLDNVTTVLLIGPMTITVCRLLDIDPVPFFMTQILASNIGGTATLIGDPPNIMIGSAAGYTFADFIAYDAPAVIIILLPSSACSTSCTAVRSRQTSSTARPSWSSTRTTTSRTAACCTSASPWSSSWSSAS